MWTRLGNGDIHPHSAQLPVQTSRAAHAQKGRCQHPPPLQFRNSVKSDEILNSVDTHSFRGGMPVMGTSRISLLGDRCGLGATGGAGPCWP